MLIHTEWIHTYWTKKIGMELTLREYFCEYYNTSLQWMSETVNQSFSVGRLNENSNNILGEIAYENNDNYCYFC